MFAVLVYDIPSDDAGMRRRNKIYKLCKKYGYHVQNSVFELDVDYTQLLRIEHEIEGILDGTQDSVRVYSLGKSRTDNNVICLGKREICESDEDSFIL